MSDFESVETRGLTKTYGATRALASVDLLMQASRVTAVLGPNGSGKSTLLGLLAGLARPTRGEVLYGGQSVVPRHRIGLLAHAPMVYPELTARENLEFFADMFLTGRHDVAVARAMERMELRDFADRAARTYSRGQLQRLALARALLHEPKLLLLDEPSTGLDEAASNRLVAEIEAERKRGAIVVLVTHDATLVERVAHVQVLLHQGRVRDVGAVEAEAC